MPMPRKPDALKRRDGTFQPCRSTPNAPSPPHAIPKPPASLSAKARKVWPDVSSVLDSLGVLTSADTLAVEGLAECLSELRAARLMLRKRGGPTYETITKDGSTMFRPHPEVAMISDLDKRLRGWLSSFGATPADRSRVSAIITNDEPDDVSMWQ